MDQQPITIDYGELEIHTLRASHVLISPWWHRTRASGTRFHDPGQTLAGEPLKSPQGLGRSVSTLLPGQDLRSLVLSLLQDQDLSISSCAKRLEQEGYRFHRLYVAGYLKGLADLGLLQEKNIPPAKVYAVRTQAGGDLHMTLGEVVKDRARGQRRIELAIATLHRLHNRPVFSPEWERTGLEGTPTWEPLGKEASDPFRREVTRSGYRLPRGARAYEPPEDEMEALEGEIQEVLLTLLVRQLGITPYQPVTQATLGS